MSRRGRKRKANVYRQPAGKVVQPLGAEKTEKITAAALWARTNHYGEDIGLKLLETSELGRLLATGELSRRQYNAATKYQEIDHEYHRMQLTRPVPSASDMDRTHGHDDSDGDDPAYVLRFNRSVEMWHRVHKALNGCHDRRARSALDTVALHNISIPDSIGTLREALNAIAQELGLPH
jgi:hypothetical protein